MFSFGWNGEDLEEILDHLMTMLSFILLYIQDEQVAHISCTDVIIIFFPAPGLCSLFARAKMLYRKLVDDVVAIPAVEYL